MLLVTIPKPKMQVFNHGFLKYNHLNLFRYFSKFIILKLEGLQSS